MEIEYSGEHSITFYNVTIGNKTTIIQKNSWTDFHLIPVSRPFINYSSPNIHIVTIPGTSKRFDITDYRAGGLTFGSRTGVWEFYIDHYKYKNWKKAYDEVCNFVHGKELFLSLSDEPLVFYKGIITVSNYTAGQNYSKIDIQYDIEHDIIIGMLSSYPIKFIGENGIPYANDYGLSEGSDYNVRLQGGGKGIAVYDLTVL